MHCCPQVFCDLQVNQLLSIQKLLRLLRIARIIKLIKGFKVTTSPLLSPVARLRLHPRCHCLLQFSQQVPTHAVHSVSKFCQIHAWLQLPIVTMRSIHASALCMQSRPAGDNRTAKRRAAQLVSSCHCRVDPEATPAVICYVACSCLSCWPCHLAVLAGQQETLTASKCGQQCLCMLEMPSCPGMSAASDSINSQEPTQNASGFQTAVIGFLKAKGSSCS